MRNSLKSQLCRASWLIHPVKSHISTGVNIYLKPLWWGRGGHQAASHQAKTHREATETKTSLMKTIFQAKKSRFNWLSSRFTRTCSTEKLWATGTASRQAETPTFNTKKGIRFWDVAVMNLHTWARWLSSHWAHTTAGSKLIRTGERKSKKKPHLKFHKQLQSPTGFSLLLKQVQGSLCPWNSSWAARKTSCFSLLEVREAMGQRGYPEPLVWEPSSSTNSNWKEFYTLESVKQRLMKIKTTQQWDWVTLPTATLTKTEIF